MPHGHDDNWVVSGEARERGGGIDVPTDVKHAAQLAIITTRGMKTPRSNPAGTPAQLIKAWHHLTKCFASYTMSKREHDNCIACRLQRHFNKRLRDVRSVNRNTSACIALTGQEVRSNSGVDVSCQLASYRRWSMPLARGGTEFIGGT